MLGLSIWQVHIAALAFGLALRNVRIAFSAAVLLANWSLLHGIYQVSGDQFCVIANVGIDVACAELLILLAWNRWAAGLVLLYAGAMVAHASYAFGSQDAWSQYRYWYAMHYLVWAQAALLLAWGINDGGHRLRHWMDRRLRRRGVRPAMGNLFRHASRREV